jgi:hypothetical protein
MIDQLMNAVSDLSVNQQSAWLRKWGIDELADEGTKYWEQHKSSPDVFAIKMRSRGIEANQLEEQLYFGSFHVFEYTV